MAKKAKVIGEELKPVPVEALPVVPEETPEPVEEAAEKGPKAKVVKEPKSISLRIPNGLNSGVVRTFSEELNGENWKEAAESFRKKFQAEEV